MLSAYLIHECIHETLFTTHAAHRRLGTLLGALNGGCYAGFEELRKKHLHHHADVVDPVNLDLPPLLQRRWPRLWRLTLGLEWLHVPAIELWLRAYTIVRPFCEARWRAQRGRVAAVTAARLAGYATLLALSPRAALLYVAGGLLGLIGLRLLDAFHHSFELAVLPDYDGPLGPLPGHDRAYEHGHTFSNLLSTRWPLLNVLLLNFVFHNAHHVKPGVPWHRLPALERRLYGDDRGHWRPVRALLADFHRYRIARVVDSAGAQTGAVNLGAVQVSLLTP
jgi:fatty acid desaturase